MNPKFHRQLRQGLFSRKRPPSPLAPSTTRCRSTASCVFGIDELRVVDASVMPDLVGGSINAAVITSLKGGRSDRRPRAARAGESVRRQFDIGAAAHAAERERSEASRPVNYEKTLP
jgi:hypothetical protein